RVSPCVRSRRAFARHPYTRWMLRVASALVCLAATAEAAPRVIAGTVQHDGHPIANATVLADRGEIAVTDRDGEVTLTADTRDITIVAPGFVTRTVHAAERLDIELEAASGAEVIEVTGHAPEQTKPLSYELTADEIREIPGAGNDIMRALQALPG